MNKYDDIKRFMDKAKLENIDYKELNEKSTGESITGSMNQWTLIKQVSASEEPAGPLDNGRTTQPTPQSISADEFSLSDVHPVHTQQEPNSSAARPVTQQQATPLSSEVPHPPAGFGLLDALRETLPPVPSQPAPVTIQPAQPQPVHTAPVLHAQSVVPDSGSGLLDSLRKAMPAAPSKPAPTQVQSVPLQASQSVPQPVAPVYHQPPVHNPTPVHSPVPAVSASPASADANQRFKQMFKQRAPQPASAYLHRDTPLQPLLEMIASCR
ncbi:cellulose biosynthesis protein BcsO [Rahnella perminowiae]|uniref:cellulose biosynthesis protein BcsO n=1 Tax=Rahnella perminowiae TaxID=2816244 RepID=UPI00215C999C|nr:cellulose biosynthesis protein BcsO [Rahnella perminowiae]MCR8999165.1 cellulose biosynthesis protein BcsO [Rahnella perminowiae]